MNWDGNKIYNHFIGLYAIQNHERYLNMPKHEAFEDLHDIELALKDLYSTCAQNAWTEERLLNALEKIITIPKIRKKAENPKKYIATKTEEAEKLKCFILNKTFIF